MKEEGNQDPGEPSLGYLESSILEAFSAINSVHDLSALPTISVTISASERFGGYTPGADDRPAAILLSRSSPHPCLTLVHEVGHYIDDGQGNFAVYSSMTANSVLAEVMQTIGHSRAVNRIHDYLALDRKVPLPVRYQLRHWIEPVESWARAYAQYITLRSGGATLRHELDTAIGLGGLEVYRNVQWEEDDFEPIAFEIDSVFYRLGWRR